MLDLMLREPGREGVRALLPPDVPVAHRGGWTEVVTHDAAIVLPPGGEAYVLIVLTEGFAEIQSAWHFVAGVSQLMHVAN
jgi:beta-lactamase class A